MRNDYSYIPPRRGASVQRLSGSISPLGLSPDNFRYPTLRQTRMRLQNLQYELNEWNDTWTKLMSMMTSVYPFPPQYPITGDDQRRILETLCDRVCRQLTNRDHDTDLNEQLMAKLNKKKNLLEAEKRKR